MKYSVRGNLINATEDDLYLITDNYPIRQLVTSKYLLEDRSLFLNFEVWVAKEITKTELFNDLKPLIDTFEGYMSWHICYHDELPTKPCEEPQEPYGVEYGVV